MPFDPNIPASHTKLNSAEMRAQFNALKALIDALAAAGSPGVVPIGGIIPWAKNSFNVPLTLPPQFMECSGQVVNDAESPLNGETLPDLNGQQRFLRGAPISGDSGGNETHSHQVAVDLSYAGVNVDNGGSGTALDENPKTTSDASSLPPFYEVVYVIRVK